MSLAGPARPISLAVAQAGRERLPEPLRVHHLLRRLLGQLPCDHLALLLGVVGHLEELGDPQAGPAGRRGESWRDYRGTSPDPAPIALPGVSVLTEIAALAPLVPRSAAAGAVISVVSRPVATRCAERRAAPPGCDAL